MANILNAIRTFMIKHSKLKMARSWRHWSNEGPYDLTASSRFSDLTLQWRRLCGHRCSTAL